MSSHKLSSTKCVRNTDPTARQVVKIANKISKAEPLARSWDGKRVATKMYSAVGKFIAETNDLKPRTGFVKQIIRAEIQRRKRRYLRRIKFARLERYIPAKQENRIEMTALLGRETPDILVGDSLAIVPSSGLAIIPATIQEDVPGNVISQGWESHDADIPVTSRSQPQMQTSLTTTRPRSLQTTDPSSFDEAAALELVEHQSPSVNSGTSPASNCGPTLMGMDIDDKVCFTKPNFTFSDYSISQDNPGRLVPWTGERGGSEHDLIDFNEPNQATSSRVCLVAPGQTEEGDQDDFGQLSVIVDPFIGHMLTEPTRTTSDDLGLDLFGGTTDVRPGRPQLNSRINRKEKIPARGSPTKPTNPESGAERLVGPQRARYKRDHRAAGQSATSETSHATEIEVADGAKRASNPCRTSAPPRPTIRTQPTGGDPQSHSTEILHRIADQLGELRRDQKDLSLAFGKLEEKVDSLEQQSIASRSVTVERSNTRPRTRRSGGRAGQFVIPKPRARRGDDRNEFMVVL
ncbi:hypothetical protein V5O48_007214 [Marasmius crinis-equi]|uniref:Uncharacterized protein n=1 Tax=Marasmius crinis-equi TaxID=585013 RepID=A0ABR3FHI2_9AGAR